MYGFTYITTNLINGKKYIGRRKIDKYGAWKSYLGSGWAFKKALKEYGRKNFKREIIQWYDTEDELNEAEAKLIEEYDAVNNRNFYNLSIGGKTESGFHMSDERKKQLSEKIKASYTEERKEKYSKRMKENNPNADGHFTRGKKLSQEQIEAMRQRNLGKPGLKGDKNPMYGKIGNLHPSYREKSPLARKVKCLETGQIFTTLKEAGLFCGTSGSQISLCCKGINKTCMGYHWEYIGEPKYTLSLSDESKLKISLGRFGKNNPMSKPVLCIETNIIYGSAYEAGRAYNIHGESISNCCKGKSHSSANLHWRYLTNDDYDEFEKE